ncbi:2-amino-4-hydroxy-6-hydroxymethyldihydropteridine diphosphokinase [Acidiphilium sp. AL]|uniref:2-amino-4-hydroxy-6-hydroxymethyldihydropteridine pyrophosphokinase n=1 Tax=Acidiphilium iwatense TaxID=768198 RepID=A0ABS9DXE6_9PROT|nr:MULTISPECIES: 2-amino-4-hydroxy-6-hydroxymethyldihydropteridine diphosphokinase [Acidiphilium]MCF3946865.1 2-amino-4-hydroxy-6-hydroxymethyldihydropteridine diphosphokinase [Acidiphilium iwatense]MCU4161050.1 2-amino-4-hydroxy-6-hydroxymethyldihydropteridine diphosphokinase [Acidiphilium sp. AL]
MILIAIGANLPGPDGASPRDTCIRALEAVRALPGLEFRAVSPWYRTTPVPRDASQPDFCNGVARFDVARFAGVAEPEALLAALHRIEAEFGRERSVPNAARTLDLDLIDLNGLVRDAPPPILPHPRAHLRAFVLRPLLDVAPDWVHPRSGAAGMSLLDTVPGGSDAPIGRW